LQNPTTNGGNAVYACIHEADYRPYVLREAPNYNRGQYFFDCDTWAAGYSAAMSAFRISELHNSIGAQAYQNSFTCNTPINWVMDAGPPQKQYTFYTAPMGVCYSVWAEVGADFETNNLNTGWLINNQSSSNIAEFQVNLPAGWSTIYFPIIKSLTPFPSPSQLTIHWVRASNGFVRQHGLMDLKDMPDGYSYTDYANTTQWIYPAMVFPVVCQSNTAQTITLRIGRNFAGPIIYLGRPVVRPGACSWLNGQ
jgi:hypothetical protein